VATPARCARGKDRSLLQAFSGDPAWSLPRLWPGPGPGAEMASCQERQSRTDGANCPV